MKRWAFLTVALYMLALVVLTAPVLLIAFGTWWGRPNGTGADSAKVFEVFREWGLWVWIGVMALGQLLLLLVPVDVSQRKLVPRRKLLVPIITSAFLLAVIVFSAVLAVACAMFGDNTSKYFEMFGDTSVAAWAVFFLTLAVLWTVWGVVFYRTTRQNEPPDAAARMMRWLLKGSILELLVAVPSHVIVRQRDVCCAPMGSFWGIATGLSVMLLCYGPGVFFLFAARFARKRAGGNGIGQETEPDVKV